MPEEAKQTPDSGDKATVTLPGVVEKIIPPVASSQPEKAQIAVEGADHLYREIRVVNVLKDAEGNEVALKVGAEIDVTIEADPADTKPAAKPSDHTGPERRRSPRTN